ncbi:MAG: phosphoribosyltransferase family protein [Pseudomonadota bacterium]|nr:phosphoribosyltransferase family protein [Pseudomonadota bacterium]
MHDFDIPAANESLTALQKLSDRAALSAGDDAESILFHYPTAKLGLRSSIRYCAAKLADAARDLLASNAATEPWVISSPPRFVLPGAANLLARELSDLLCTGDEPAPALVDLRLSPNAAEFETTDSSRLYSQAGFEARVQERSRLHHRLRPLAAEQFQGRSALFVNDINVTGAQQHFMRQAMQAAGVARIHWLYLVAVPPEVGRAHPQIEYELNYSRHASFEAFAELVRHADMEFTARCIHRLFDHEESELRVFLNSLQDERRRYLIELASQEARCQGRATEYWEKLQRLSA